MNTEQALCLYIEELRGERDTVRFALSQSVDGLRAAVQTEQKLEAAVAELDTAHAQLRDVEIARIKSCDELDAARAEVERLKAERDQALRLADERNTSMSNAESALCRALEDLDRVASLGGAGERVRELRAELAEAQQENARLRVLVGDIAIRPEEHKPSPLPDGVPGEEAAPVLTCGPDEVWCNGYGRVNPFPLAAWESREKAKAAGTDPEIDAEHYSSDAVRDAYAATKVAEEREAIASFLSHEAAMHTGPANAALTLAAECVRARGKS